MTIKFQKFDGDTMEIRSTDAITSRNSRGYVGEIVKDLAPTSILSLSDGRDRVFSYYVEMSDSDFNTTVTKEFVVNGHWAGNFRSHKTTNGYETAEAPEATEAAETDEEDSEEDSEWIEAPENVEDYGGNKVVFSSQLAQLTAHVNEARQDTQFAKIIEERSWENVITAYIVKSDRYLGRSLESTRCVLLFREHDGVQTHYDRDLLIEHPPIYRFEVGGYANFTQAEALERAKRLCWQLAQDPTAEDSRRWGLRRKAC